MFFVVTTGRSGSQSLAHILDQHPLCDSFHEPHRLLVKLAGERANGLVDDEELRKYLFQPTKMFPHRVGLRLYGESDNRLSFMIPLLAELGTSTKFIWLIRDGRDVVASFYVRGMHRDGETRNPRHLWDKYRIQGDLCGDVDSAKWKSMSRFEKVCWYWSYTNRTIENDLEKAGSSWMMLKLENLAPSLTDVLSFLDLPYYPLRTVRSNTSPTPVYQWESWTEDERAAFDSWCGEGMDRWYPGWRDGNLSSVGSTNQNLKPAQAAVKSIGSHLSWFASKAIGVIR